MRTLYPNFPQTSPKIHIEFLTKLPISTPSGSAVAEGQKGQFSSIYTVHKQPIPLNTTDVSLHQVSCPYPIQDLLLKHLSNINHTGNPNSKKKHTRGFSLTNKNKPYPNIYRQTYIYIPSATQRIGSEHITLIFPPRPPKLICPSISLSKPLNSSTISATAAGKGEAVPQPCHSWRVITEEESPP